MVVSYLSNYTIFLSAMLSSGFVAGMRKKNRKTCFPFKSPGNGDVDLVDYLPPLSVPEFRCWQCSSCIPNDGTKRTSEETSALALNDACTSSCGNARGRKDGLFIHSRESTGNAETIEIALGIFFVVSLQYFQVISFG